MFSRTAKSGRLKGGTGLVLEGGGGGARVAGSADSSTGSGSGSWKSVNAVLLAPVADVVVVLELSDVRDAVGEVVEPRPSVSWLGLCEIGDMTEVAGSSTAPPNGWMV